MKPWKPLLALFALAPLAAAVALVAAPATADVLFKGLQYSPQGVVIADLDQDGKLDLHNIGSSGQDGVSIWSPRSNGARVVLEGSCSPATDEGSSVSLQYSWRLASQPAGSPAQLSSAVFTVTNSGGACSGRFGALSSSPTMDVSLYRGGALVYSATVDRATALYVAMDATGQCPNPALSIAKVNRTAGEQCDAGFAFPQTVSVTVAGHTEDCDDAVCRCPVDNDCDGVSNQLFVVATPTSSFRQVRCSDGSCRVMDHWVSCTGAAALDFATFAGAPSSAARRLPVHNLGSSGQDGVEVELSRRAPASGSGGGGGGGSVDADDDGAAVSAVFAHPSLSFDPATDLGASEVITISGQSFSAGASSPASVTMSLSLVSGSCSNGACTSSWLKAAFDHSSLGASAESVVVLSHGVEVARCAMPPGGFVQVSAPPDGVQAFAIASAGAKKEFKGHVTLLKTRLGSGSSGDTSVPMEVCFRCDRVLVIGGLPPVTGDQLVCWGGGDCSSGSCSDGFVASSSQLRVTCPTPTCSLSSLDLFALPGSTGDQVFADVSGTTALTSTQTCVRVPVVFTRVDQTPMRAFSVTFHLSSELAQCGASVVEGNYLSRVAGTQMFVTDNGGGSFTVDCGILGGVCGATGSGTLFSVDLSAVQPVSTDAGTITVDDVRARDCSNSPVPAFPGGSSVLAIQTGAPPALTALSASTQKSGNLVVSGTPGGSVAAVVVRGFNPSTKQYVDTEASLYRMPFGNYPLYDKGTSPGHVPSPPASSAAALAAGWSPVTCSSGTCSSGACGATCSATTIVDMPPSRDFYYYVAFVRDVFGNESPVSNMTTGTLDYFLGDVSDGSGVCTGDDHVTFYDITALGLHYGLYVTANDSWTCLDVGPTTDFSVDGRPTVDGKVEFEDFVVFAMNFGVVSAPQAVRRPAPMAANASRLVVPALPAVGQTFDVPLVVDGTGDMQALSARLAFDPNVLEQVGVSSGSLLDQQGRPGMALSSESGDVDAALLGAGPGIAGSGEVARVTFRVKSAGDPQLALASITARDGENRTIAIAGGVAGGTAVPAHTALGFAYPNPFRQSLAFQLSLHATGPAAIGVYDVAGRRVRTLLQGEQPAGTRVVTWDGRDDSGVRLAPGAYLVRLEAAGLRETRTVRLVR